MVSRADILQIRDILAPNPGKVIFVRPGGNNASSGLEFSAAKATLASAISGVAKGDDIKVDIGSYNETVTLSVQGITLQGTTSRGAAYIEPQGTAAEGMLVLADDIALENIGVSAGATADYSLKVGSQTVSPNRFRATGCKFESKMVLLQGVGDTLFEDCEFAWMDEDAIQFAANDNGFCTQVTFENCRFHNITRDGLAKAVGGGVRNLILKDCTFDNAEDGTAPTHYVNLPGGDETGIITGCRFATPTNEADLIAIGAKILYVDNATEAGRTTGRPS